jgi:hypothetical protein
MPIEQAFHQTGCSLLPLLFDSGTERKILKFWREHEPKKVQNLIDQGILRRTLVQKANDLLDMQVALQHSENLNPVLARHEAWNRLMRIEEDAAEEAEAWGMTLEEYLNRPYS